jgi:hypothetical protein
MKIQKIQIDWIDIPVHKFLDDQRIFLTDASIICWGFHNIINHEHTCSDRFIDRLQILYSKIYERYLITLGLSDNIVGKQEIQMWMWKILEDIDMMKKYCLQEKT